MTQSQNMAAASALSLVEIGYVAAVLDAALEHGNNRGMAVAHNEPLARLEAAIITYLLESKAAKSAATEQVSGASANANTAAQAMAKFFKTTYTVVVLSESQPAVGLPLTKLEYAIGDGDCCGTVVDDGGVELTPRDMLKALRVVGGDASFFALDHLDPEE